MDSMDRDGLIFDLDNIAWDSLPEGIHVKLMKKIGLYHLTGDKENFKGLSDRIDKLDDWHACEVYHACLMDPEAYVMVFMFSLP